MKKKLFMLAVLLLGLYILTHLHFTLPGKTGYVTYRYGDISFAEELTAEEVRAVSQALNGKFKQDMYLFGVPACGFDGDISITVGDTTYLLACDSCGTVAIEGTRYYMDISDTERDILEEIFTSRGGEFPCL